MSLRNTKVSALGFDYTLRYYLSAPMAGYPEKNFPAFAEAADILRDSGIMVFSPHETKVSEETPTWKDYLRQDIRHLLDCQGIILLRGWPTSPGSRVELQVATTLEYPVWFYDNHRLLNMGRFPLDGAVR